MTTTADILAIRCQQVLARMNSVREQLARDTAQYGEWRCDYVEAHYVLDCELDTLIDAMTREVAG